MSNEINGVYDDTTTLEDARAKAEAEKQAQKIVILAKRAGLTRVESENGPVFIDVSKITAIVPVSGGSRLLPSGVTFNVKPDELIERLMEVA
jgi:hypothetical protein